ncbi:hypothetical protein WS62_11595 [Burkholderia sp. ABCPW 14]|nr:hypothetical protein WS62_11595 [Burkholderia sp. ABCPW 14]
MEIGAMEIGATEIGATEIGATEIGATEIGATEPWRGREAMRAALRRRFTAGSANATRSRPLRIGA